MELPESREMEFRDGKRQVRDYLADMMAGLPTHTMTYLEAIDAANKRTFSVHVNAKLDAHVAAHFKEPR